MPRIASIASPLLLALLLGVSLAGCGQRGPLYLPGDEEAAERYAPGEERQAEGDGDETAVPDEEE
jgi:predicted small lipoprotein YifL